MSQDGRAQVVPRKIKNDRPNKHDHQCECGGTYYCSPSARFARCSNGEMRCMTCHRTARRFGGTYSCGLGCTPR